MWLTCLLAFAAASQKGGDSVPLLSPGGPIESAIIDADERVHTPWIDSNAEERVLAKRFSLRVETAGDYWIDLRSLFFDAYLVLRDEPGQVLAEDDDGGLATHARIATRLDAGKVYALDACALHGGRGAFELTLSAERPPVLSPLEKREQDFAEAKRAVEACERVLGPEHPGTATALNTLAELLRTRGDYAAARPCYERALAIREKALGPEDPFTAWSLASLARLLSLQGDYAAARPLYERALALHESLVGLEHPLTANDLDNLAGLLRDQGDYAQARPLCQRALAIREKVLGPDDPMTATSLTSLGLLLLEQGDYAAARPLCERALAIRERALGQEDSNTAESLEILAHLLFEQGDYAAARPLDERALAIRMNVLGPKHPATAASLNDIAMLLQVQRDYAGARVFLERVVAIDDEVLGPDDPATITGVHNLAVMIAAQGDYAAAMPYFERALAVDERMLGPWHPNTAKMLGNLAFVLHEQGKYAAARQYEERALAIREKALGRDHPDTALSLDSLACLLFDSGDRAGAFDLIRRSWQSTRTRRTMLLPALSEKESFAYLSSIRSEIDKLLSFAAETEPGDECYQAVLDWKGQVSRGLVASRAQLFAHLDEAQRASLARLGSVESQISKLAFAQDVQDAPAHERALVELRKESDRIDAELRRSLSAGIPEDPGVERVRDALEPGSALIDFFVHKVRLPARRADGKPVGKGSWTPPRVSVWITRPDRKDSVHVDLGPAADLEGAVASFLQELVSRRGVGAQAAAARCEAAAELRRLLWDPIAPHLDGVQRVFVSPDGFLGTLPFEALTLADESFLVEHHSFVYEQSPASLVSGKPQTNRFDSLLALGGIDYAQRAELDDVPQVDAKEPAAVATASLAASHDTELRGSFESFWAPLRNTSYEAEVVNGLHALVFTTGTRLMLQGDDATEERLKRELPLHSVAHVATHGFFNPEGIPSLWKAALEESGKEPSLVGEADRHLIGKAPGLLSGIVCAGANAAPEEGRDDGYLTAEEVGWLDLSKVELVVLSACETALGRAQSGEGLLGLRRAFEIAGAKTVISSLWSVKDESTSKLMQSFYENLWRKKMGRADALRAAQLEMLAKNRAEFHDALPSTWGAFVLSGEWR